MSEIFARAARLFKFFFIDARCRTQDDLAIMIEGADGQYYLQAGAVLLAGTRIFLLFSIYLLRASLLR